VATMSDKGLVFDILLGGVPCDEVQVRVRV
jgi:hypothetical protein